MSSALGIAAGGFSFRRLRACAQQGMVGLACAVAFVAGGKLMAQDRKDQKPEWMGNRIGVSDQVIPPWTPLRVDEASVRCWGREYFFGEAPLPQRLVTRARSVLAGPIRITGKAAGQPLEWQAKQVGFTSRSPAKATWRYQGAAAGLKLDIRAQVEFDGMMRIDARIGPKGAALDELTLEIPVKAEHARYIHYSAVNWSGSDARSTGGETWEWHSRFMPYVWLGDEERGLAWFAESDEGWQLGDPDRAIAVEKAGGVATLRVRFVDKPIALANALSLTFGLQATPVKPVPARYHRIARIWHGAHYGMENDPAPDGKGGLLDYLWRQGVRTIVFHQQWTEYYGLPITRENGAKLKSLTEACHRRGLKILLYFGYGLADISPEGKRCHDDMVVLPVIRWSDGRGAADAFDAFCTRSAYSDFLLWGMDRLITEYDIDGIYFDGTSEPWACQNRKHGCGYLTPAGELRPTYPIFAARDIIRRTYTLFRARKPARPGKDSIINVHMSANLTIPTLAFADSYWDGEQFESLQYGQQAPLDVLPLDKFRAEFMGKQWGLAAEFLVYEKRPFTTEEALAFTMLHDVLVRPADTSERLSLISRIWRAREDFGAERARWFPYWDARSPARSEQREILVSLHSRPGRGALLVVSNLGARRATARIRLDLAALELPANVQATDALTSEKIPLSGARLSFPLNSMGWRMVWVRAASAASRRE
jgi:hypothetical protein